MDKLKESKLSNPVGINKYKHLKNLNIEELVGQNKEVKPDYDKSLKIIKNVRTAFASSKAALLTFINDVAELETKVYASMNTNELESIRDQFIGLINTLNSAIMSSFFVVKRYINIKLESSKLDNPDNIPCFTSIYLRTDIPGTTKTATLCTVPGMLIHINHYNNRVILKITEPLYTGIDDEELRTTKEYILSPSLIVDYERGSESIFNNGDTVKKIFQSMVNYLDVPNLDDMTFEEEPLYNEINGAIEFLERNIIVMENTHRTVTNMAKIDKE
jgi:hypothetical protein